MKKRKILSILFVFIAVLSFCACTGKTMKSYSDAETFEAALDAGEDVVDSEVTFTVKEIVPNSRFGYCVRAGKHLNFSMKEEDGVSVGDTVTIRVNAVGKYGPSWAINYKDYAQPEVKEGEGNTEEKNESNHDYQVLMLGKKGFFAKSPYDDSDDMIYLYFAGEVINLSDAAIAQSPKLTITVRNSNEQILATADATGTIIMPEDRVILTGMVSIPKTNGWKDSTLELSTDCRGFVKESFFYKPVRTDEFEFKNISSDSGKHSYVAGEVTNNSSEDFSMVEITMVLEKDGAFVYAEHTYVALDSGQTKAFQFQKYGKWPEYDKIKVSVSSAI